MKTHLPRIALLLALAVSFGVSQFSGEIDPYVLNILLMIGIHIILAVSLNLVNGHTGQFSLGHAGFMAVGAYVSSAITLFWGKGFMTALGEGTLGTSLLFLCALAAGGLLAALFGLVVGVPSLRLRGDYLAIVTLGFGEIIRVVIQNTNAVGGPRGLGGIPQYTTFFWTFGLAAVTIYVIANLVDSTYGRGFLAVRDDEVAAEAMGINTTKYKVVAFVIGAFFAGIAGGLYAHYFQYITPEGFNFVKSVDIVIMVILGGMGSTVGVVVGAIALTLLPQGLLWIAEQINDFDYWLRSETGRDWIPNWVTDVINNRMLILALLLIVMMILRPQGIVGDLAWLKRKRRPQP